MTRGKNDDVNTSGVTKADTVTIGLKLALPVSLDIRHQSGSAIEQVLIGNVYEALLSRDSDNKVQPGLAKSWDISKDGKTYTFHLNQNMTFSTATSSTLTTCLVHQPAQGAVLHRQPGIRQGRSGGRQHGQAHPFHPDSNLLYLTGRPASCLDKNAKYNAKTEAVARPVTYRN